MCSFIHTCTVVHGCQKLQRFHHTIVEWNIACFLMRPYGTTEGTFLNLEVCQAGQTERVATRGASRTLIFGVSDNFKRKGTTTDRTFYRWNGTWCWCRCRCRCSHLEMHEKRRREGGGTKCLVLMRECECQVDQSVGWGIQREAWLEGG